MKLFHNKIKFFAALFPIASTHELYCMDNQAKVEQNQKENSAEANIKDSNKLDMNGMAAIHYAAANNQLQALENLCNTSGIDLDVPDIHGRTAVHHAAINGHGDCIKLLAQKGANLNLLDKMCWDTIKIRGNGGNKWRREVYKWELRYSQKFDGCTPLHLALLYEKREAIAALADCGADQKIVDFANRNPYVLFIEYHQRHDTDFYKILETGQNKFLFKQAATKRSKAFKQKLQEVLGKTVLPDLQKIILEYAEPTLEDLKALGTATRVGNSIKKFFGFAPALE